MTEKAPDCLFYRESLQSKNSLIVSTVERPDEHDIEYVRCTLQRLKDLERVAELSRWWLSLLLEDMPVSKHDMEKRSELDLLLRKLNGGGDAK